ncbi:MAG: hypothetical protein QGG42_02015 [Phycisphaerae bacterium]|jgi:hypothetical protein|nr:hypothetical protein [Phycisphaerae bacterium]
MTGPNSSQSSTDASDSAPQVRRGAGKRKWFWVFYAVLLIASVGFAIYQGVRFFRGDEGTEEPTRFTSVRRSSRIGPPEQPPTTGPSEMTGNPLAGVSMTPVKKDPEGLLPPNGAVRRWAFERRTGDEVEMMASYAWRGSEDQAVDYYKEYLGGKGMKFLGEHNRKASSASTRPRPSRVTRPRRVLVFQGLKRTVTITLRPGRGADGMLSITLDLSYPDS